MSLRINLIKVDLFPLNMIPYSTLVAMAAVGTSPMPVFFALIIFNQPEVVLATTWGADPHVKEQKSINMLSQAGEPRTNILDSDTPQNLGNPWCS